MQIIKKLISCLTFVIASKAASGQSHLTQSAIDSIAAIIDTSSVKLALTTKPSKEGYLLSKAEYYIDLQGSLNKVVYIYGDHPGRVNGHLSYSNTYFYYNDKPIKAVVSTLNFKDTTRRSTYYFGVHREKGRSHRACTVHEKTAKSFLDYYYSEIPQKGG